VAAPPGTVGLHPACLRVLADRNLAQYHRRPNSRSHSPPRPSRSRFPSACCVSRKSPSWGSLSSCSPSWRGCFGFSAIRAVVESADDHCRNHGAEPLVAASENLGATPDVLCFCFGHFCAGNRRGDAGLAAPTALRIRLAGGHQPARRAGTGYGLATRVWTLAICSQIFLGVSACEFLQRWSCNKSCAASPPGCCLPRISTARSSFWRA